MMALLIAGKGLLCVRVFSKHIEMVISILPPSFLIKLWRWIYIGTWVGCFIFFRHWLAHSATIFGSVRELTQFHFNYTFVHANSFEQTFQVCKVSVSTMLAVVALDPAWAAWCWNGCLWTTARRARFLSLCGAAHRWPLQWWNPTTQRLGPFWSKKIKH